ncbi:hypothetical protein NMG60_11013183 [Bertholletia excelsa]
MGKQSGKKKRQAGPKLGDSNVKESKVGDNSLKAYDKDMAVFISMSRELKDEGNKLFQKRDYEGAMLKYEKAIKLLPRNHIDVSYLRSNMAACYMQLGLSEYPRAIHECNLALEVTPKYSKALLKRARCYEALGRLDFAERDVNTVLKMEPNNLMAIEIVERLRITMEKKGIRASDIPSNLILEQIEPRPPLPLPESVKEKQKKKKGKKLEENRAEEEIEKKAVEANGEIKKTEEKLDEKQTEIEAEDTRTEEKKAEPEVEGAMTEEKKAIKVKEARTGEKSEEDKVEIKVKEMKPESKSDEKKVKKVQAKRLEKTDKKKAKKAEEKVQELEIRTDERMAQEKIEEKKAEDKLVVEEKISIDEEVQRNVKLVFGDDIRWAQVPFSCSILKLREVISDRFPNSKAVLIKYKDQEGDLVTITTNEELRWAEASSVQGSLRLYIVEVNPEQDPFYSILKREEETYSDDIKYGKMIENGSIKRVKKPDMPPTCMDDWIIQFAQLFKNYVGFNSDTYLDLHELGMKVYSEALEETVTSEEAQDHFNAAAEKFQEMAALALFNWGNVHVSRARKRAFFAEDASKESVMSQIQTTYDWAQKEYIKAGKRYEEALRIKPDFYEAVVALGQQQFEQAKLSWYHALGTNVDLETWPSNETIQLYNYAENNMEKGMQMWEEAEDRRLNEESNPNKVRILMQKMGLEGIYRDLSTEEAAEQAANMRSQINLLWGTMLYERSVMEFKLGLPVWQECLEVAVEKFEHAGASHTDIAVMIKNHCSNDTAAEGVGFNIDEIVQAWNEMYEAKKWQSDVPSFRLEPLLRRRGSKFYHVLEHA